MQLYARPTTVKLALGAGSSRRAAAGPVRVLRHGEERLKAALLAPMVTLVGALLGFKATLFLVLRELSYSYSSTKTGEPVTNVTNE